MEKTELYDALSLLYKKDQFPRQVLVYRRWVDSYDDLIKIVEKYNGKDDVYVSVFYYPTRNLDEPVVDRIVFDFDWKNKEEAYDEKKRREIVAKVYSEVKKFCAYLESVDLRPNVFFTGGRGFHVYLFFEEPLQKLQKSDLIQLVEYLKEKLKLEYIDPKITYDFARLIRVPYTIHTETRLYCIPVNTSWSIDKILELAKNPIIVPIVPRYSKALNLIAEIEKARIKSLEKKELQVAPAVKFSGKYLSLPCVNLLFSYKLPAGKRRMKASKIIAIAYYLDHGTMDGFEEVAKIFAKAQDIDHKLRFREVLGWKRGIYRLHQPPQWNCKEIQKYLLECKIKLPCKNCELRREMLKQKLEEERKAVKSIIEKLGDVDLLVEVKKILDEYVEGEDELKVLLYLLLLTKQNVILKGEYASGKNTIADAVINLFPSDMVFTISSYTQKILRWISSETVPILYLKELPPEVLGRAGQLRDFTFDLKLVMSDKVLEVAYVGRGEDGEFETKTKKIKVESVLQTTPALDMPEDYKSRVWILSTDPSEEQTMRVLLKKARERKVIKKTNNFNLEEIRKLNKFLFSLDVPVVIPFAETIARHIKIKSTKMRREIDRLFDLISAIAKVRFANRVWKTKDGDFIIVAEIEDFMLSRLLFEEYIRLSVFDMEKRFTEAIRVFNKISKERGQVTLTEFAREMKTTKKKAKEILDILVDRGLVEHLEDNDETYATLSVEIDMNIFEDISLKELEEEKIKWLEENELEKACVDEFLDWVKEVHALELR